VELRDRIILDDDDKVYVQEDSLVLVLNRNETEMERARSWKSVLNKGWRNHALVNKEIRR
jgi:predicted DCC family thiol-disulfide oxidoreductase YuxK